MRLSLKKSFNNWIEIEGEDGKVKFLIDYPTREQEQELQSILFSKKYTGDDLGLKYSQRYLKYVIKDWEGLFDDDGNAVKCEIVNNELEDDLWWSLVKDGANALNLFLEFNKELTFTPNDKKK